jgi:hypothetical protein
MSDDEIERELGRLTPAAPSAALRARLIETRSRFRKVVPFPYWAPLAAVACALFLLLLRTNGPSRQPSLSSPSVETFRPVETDRYLISARDLGVIELEPGRPYRLVQCVWADRETFRSETSRSRLEVRQARQQIVPLALTAL